MNTRTFLQTIYKSLFLLLALVLTGNACGAQSNPSYDNLTDKRIIKNWLAGVVSNESLVYNSRFSDLHGNRFDEVANLQEKPLLFPGYNASAAIILVTHDTYCGFCIAELDFWNTLYNSDEDGNLNNIDLLMVVVDSENENFQHFLTRNRYSIPAVMDSNRRIEEIVERYYIPFKLLILADGSIADVSQIGGQNDINRYLNFVHRQISK